MAWEMLVLIQRMDTIEHQSLNLFLNEQDEQFIHVSVIIVMRNLTGF